eukprot:1610341-Rhodomonas_salina.1
MWLVSVLWHYAEGKVLDVVGDRGIVHFAANKPLGVEDGIVRIHGRLALGGITNQPLVVVECHPRWSGAVALFVGNDLNT